jgi:ribosome-binding factor A
MASSSVSTIKRAQKESLLFREISQLFMHIAIDNPTLQSLCVNRVKLSPDKGSCTVYFYTSEGEARFNELLSTLILYKPSIRKAVAARIQSRYTPELIFKFDTNFEKQCRIEALLEQIKTD